MGVPGERNKVEGIFGVKPVQCQFHRLLCFFDRKTAHRTGRVQNENDLFRRSVLRRHPLRRRKYQAEKTSFFRSRRQYRIFHPLTDHVVAKDKILVRDRLSASQ
jgi:hypothetical protein